MGIREAYARTWQDDLGNSGYADRSWEDLRMLRNNILKSSDVHMLIDRYNSLTDEQKTEITDWRQSLRDIPTQFETSNEGWDNFPEPPTWVILDKTG